MVNVDQYLVGGSATPLKRMSSSNGMMTFPICGKNMFQTTNAGIFTYMTGSVLGFQCRQMLQHHGASGEGHPDLPEGISSSSYGFPYDLPIFPSLFL